MKVSFKVKIIGLISGLSLLSVMISAMSYKGLNRVEDTYERVTDGVMPNLNLINNMYLEYRAVRINLRSLGLPDLTEQEAKAYITQAQNAIAAYEKLDGQYNQIPFVPGEQELYEQMNKNWKSFKGLGQKILDIYQQGGKDRFAQLDRIFKVDCLREAQHMDEAVAKIKAFHTQNGVAYVAEAKSEGDSTNRLMIIVSLIGIGTGLSIGFVFATKVAAKISAVAEGLASNAEQVAATSSQIASSSQALSEASNEQAASLEQTAASLEEITAMISKATDSAETTSNSSAQSQSKAEEGRQAVEEMLTSMDEISQSNEAILSQINESNRQMSEIVKVIQDIGNRTKVINEIVFQTKLLSFNASVEAARAGEHGKGFAVVAEEVGNLAQMSGNAAKEITDMLSTSIAKVETIVSQTQERVEGLIQNGKRKVDSGVQVAKQCSHLLNEIVQNVSAVSGLALEISQAAKEQAQGVGEINKAMTQLDSVTQTNSASSQEAATAAGELSAQAASLKASVGELMSVITGAHDQSAPVPRKESKVVRTTAQVVPFKTAPKKQPSAGASTTARLASGDYSKVPHPDDEGFQDL